MANNLIFVPNQENEERRRSLQGPVGVYKRHLKNVPTSESKRKPLTAISSNHQQYEGIRGQALLQQTNMEVRAVHMYHLITLSLSSSFVVFSSSIFRSVVWLSVINTTTITLSLLLFLFLSLLLISSTSYH